jgi:hypothetical protein
MRQNHFLGRFFVRGGMIKFSKWKVPPTEGSDKLDASLTQLGVPDFLHHQIASEPTGRLER